MSERQKEILANISRARDIKSRPLAKATRREANTLLRHNVHADQATISALTRMVAK